MIVESNHGIAIGKETVRKLMAEAGLWIQRKLRSPAIYQPRNRRHCLGELIQIDGSDHRWFADRTPTCTLLVCIDDATSRLMLRVNRKQVDKGPGITQFGRILYQLNIEILCANSCRAKVRVERANLTLQDRLVKQLRLRAPRR